MTSEAQNSLVAFRPLPLPSEVKTSTFSILPIVISESFRQLGGYFTLSHVPCPCYFSTFSIPKSKPINGQAPPLSLPPLSHWALTSPSITFPGGGNGADEKTVIWQGSYSWPSKADKAEMTMGWCASRIGPENFEKFLCKKKLSPGWQLCSALVGIGSTWSVGYF